MLGVRTLERESTRPSGKTEIITFWTKISLPTHCKYPGFPPPGPFSVASATSLLLTRLPLLLPLRHLTCQAVLSCSSACPHTSRNSWWLLKSSWIVSCLSPFWQTVKEESGALPAVNPLVTPQKSGNTLDNSLHKDLFGAISGIGNAQSSCFLLWFNSQNIFNPIVC